MTEQLPAFFLIIADHDQGFFCVETWVRGGSADGWNSEDISMVYDGQIRGVCLSRGGPRRRLLDQEDLLRH
jgi:hypothetical protein